VVPASGEISRRWVRFADTVDFTRCMPVEQEPRVGKAKDELRRMKDEAAKMKKKAEEAVLQPV
jgi:hypothetical protein